MQSRVAAGQQHDALITTCKWLSSIELKLLSKTSTRRLDRLKATGDATLVDPEPTPVTTVTSRTWRLRSLGAQFPFMFCVVLRLSACLMPITCF
jgi:hypothetical protein